MHKYANLCTHTHKKKKLQSLRSKFCMQTKHIISNSCMQTKSTHQFKLVHTLKIYTPIQTRAYSQNLHTNSNSCMHTRTTYRPRKIHATHLSVRVCDTVLQRAFVEGVGRKLREDWMHTILHLCMCVGYCTYVYAYVLHLCVKYARACICASCSMHTPQDA
jgi:hypothetical protein